MTLGISIWLWIIASVIFILLDVWAEKEDTKNTQGESMPERYRVICQKCGATHAMNAKYDHAFQ